MPAPMPTKTKKIKESLQLIVSEPGLFRITSHTPMKKQLFCLLLSSLAACTPESDVQPSVSTLAGEVSGTYQTNPYVNPSCVAIPASQMPTVTLRPEADGGVSLVYAYQFPKPGSQQLTGVSLSRRADSAVQLIHGDAVLGTVQIDRVFTSNGMEKQGKLLRVTVQPDGPYFAGVKD